MATRKVQSPNKVILPIGLNGKWDSESWDRSDKDLPLLNNELAKAVLKAYSNTSIVSQSGECIVMPCLSNAKYLSKPGMAEVKQLKQLLICCLMTTIQAKKFRCHERLESLTIQLS